MARILIVDDDPTVLALERLILSEAGHDVLWADTASAGMELLRLYQIDLLIVDVMMPEISGFRLIDIVKGNPKIQKFPIAFLTSKHEKKDVLRAGELGADLYIMKPIQREDFLRKIAALFVKYPPKVHPEVKFQQPRPAETKIYHSTHIASISELGIEILSEAHFELDQVAELSASVFHEIPLKCPLLRVSSIQPDKNNLNRVRLVFMDKDASTIQRIQRWISYQKQKR